MIVASHMYNRDGAFIELEEQSLTNLVLEHVGDRLFGFMCWATPEWTYELRWGPKDEEFGLSDQSVGHKLYLLGQFFGSGFGAWNKRKTLARIPVDPSWDKFDGHS